MNIQPEGVRPMIMVYDSWSRSRRPFTPIEPGHVSIYVCGVTPYAEAHIGHARPAVVWDAIKRHLRRRGYVVRHVQNFTDIDDKLVERAAQLGMDVGALARVHIDQYNRLMAKLGVVPPDFAPRVTDNVEEIIEFVQTLVDRGHAYVSGGDVYFRVAADSRYGELSGRRIEEQLSGTRVQLADNKAHAEDFALWKSVPATLAGWQSPWGLGRPGWHIECSVMSSRYLGERFDFHGGGIDLIFPHHENELAQSRAYFGQNPVGCWVHNGLVTQGEVKMSKSLGNGVGLADLLDSVPAPVLRTYLLSVHYRSPLDFSLAGLGDWQRGWERMRQLWDRVKEAPAPSRLVSAEWAERLLTFEDRMLGWMDDDFNTARALAEVFEMMRDVRRGIAAGYADVAEGLARANFVKADEVLGLFAGEESAAGEAAPREETPAVLTRLLAWRDEARRQGEYAVSDRIRDILAESGYRVEDTPTGIRVKKTKDGTEGERHG